MTMCKRALCKSSRSRHFTGAPITASEEGTSNNGRSEYFKSSPDSCAGSASSFDWGSAFTERAFRALKACEFFERSGVRHLCVSKCYFKAYEPFRRWHALRLEVARAGSSTRVLDGWSIRMDGGEKAHHSWCIGYISPDGREYASAKLALGALGLGRAATLCPTSSPTLRRNRGSSSGSPQQALAAHNATRHYPDGPAYLLKNPPAGAFPASPFGLIEELLTDDPWKLLIGCIMLNQTSRSQTDRVLWDFLEHFPTAAVAASASVEGVARIVAPLGLQKRRPVAIIRFSQEYLSKPWKKPEELFWVGKYASDAHKIFIERRWQEVHPEDHALNWLVEWMRGTQEV